MSEMETIDESEWRKQASILLLELLRETRILRTKADLMPIMELAGESVT